MHYTKEMLKAYTNDYGDVDLSRTDVSSLPDDLTISGDLNLESTEIKALPENLTVKGNLNCSRTSITSIPDSLKVGGDLNLCRTSILFLPNTLEIGGSLFLYMTPIGELPKNLKFNGDLDIGRTRILSLPENLKVNGYLDIQRTDIDSLPDGLKVSESLYMCQTNIRALPHGLVVGGMLAFDGELIRTLPDDLKVADRPINRDIMLFQHQLIHDGDYVPNEYIYVDDILTFIKREKKIGPYTYYIGAFPNHNVIYDGTYYAHCKDLKSGIQDLAFKHAKDRGADQYKNLTLDSVVSKEDAIIMYRIITGACQQGTKMFVDSLKEVKETYTIQEIIDLTRGQYNSEVFETFFE